jgi:carboxymethylenebutenolidase
MYTKVFHFPNPFLPLKLIRTKLSGTAHGFASRPNLELPEVKTAFEGALVQTVKWLEKTL